MQQDTVYYNQLEQQQTVNSCFVEIYFTIPLLTITKRLCRSLLFFKHLQSASLETELPAFYRRVSAMLKGTLSSLLP